MLGMQCYRLVATTLLASVLYASLTSGQNTEHEADDYAESGNYHILYCYANSTTSQAAYLKAFLPQVFSSLEAVLRDLKLGTASRHGYKAFFKTDDNVEAVRDVFQKMIDGPDVLSGMATQEKRLTAPTFICANEGEPDTAILRQTCGRPVRPVMYVGENQGFVTICPLFWSLRRIPPRRACPSISDNQFASDGIALGQNQFAITVHELVHLFNPHDDMRQEVYDIRDVFNLNATRSFENAHNFALYAAGKYTARTLPLPTEAKR